MKKCLEGLLKQDIQEPWEIVVVDDGSATDLALIISELNSSGLIQLHRQKNAGPARARNKGVEIAKGKYIAFTDDDCVPLPDWLSIHLKHLEKGVMTGGKTRNGLKGNLYAESSQLLINFLYSFFKNTPVSFFTSNNFAMNRETFLSIGGFDESFPTSAGEDREFCIRYIVSGFKLKYIDDAEILHYHCLDLRSFFKLHFKYDNSANSINSKIEGMNISHKVLFHPFQYRQFTYWQKTQLLTLLLLSQVANLLGRYFKSI